MKTLSVLTVIAVLALVIGLAGSQFLTPVSAKQKPKKGGNTNENTPGRDISDHALFDETSGDTGCTCSSDKSYTFYLSCQAVFGGGTAEVRVTFNDSDFIEYPIADGQSFSLVQSAGGTPGVDDELVVTNDLVGNNLVCWCSILAQSGAHPLAITAPDFCTTQ